MTKDHFWIGDIVVVELWNRGQIRKRKGKIVNIYTYGYLKFFEVKFENGEKKEVLREQIIGTEENVVKKFLEN